MVTRILVVDDHAVFREGLRLMIAEQPDMELIGQASNGRQAVEMARSLKPDVILMDVSMPGLNGVEAARKITDNNRDAKVLALSAYSGKRFVTEMLKAGVMGYVVKDCSTDELAGAIRAVMADERYLSPKVAKVVIEEYVRNEQSRLETSLLDELTPKERELLQMLAEGKSGKEAARLLYVSIKTVDTRRRSIMKKIDVLSMAELTKFAVREGITSVEF